MNKKLILLAGIFVVFFVALFLWGKNPVPSTQTKTAIVAALHVTQTVIVKDRKDTTSLAFKNGETALQLLSGTHKVTAKGQKENAFVTAIDGVVADSTKEFWSFYVNGKQATVGAGSYTLKNNDTIEWKIEAFR